MVPGELGAAAAVDIEGSGDCGSPKMVHLLGQHRVVFELLFNDGLHIQAFSDELDSNLEAQASFDCGNKHVGVRHDNRFNVLMVLRMIGHRMALIIKNTKTGPHGNGDNKILLLFVGMINGGIEAAAVLGNVALRNRLDHSPGNASGITHGGFQEVDVHGGVEELLCLVSSQEQYYDNCDAMM